MRNRSDSISARIKAVRQMIAILKHDSRQVQLGLKEMQELNRLLSEDYRKLERLDARLARRDK